MAPKKKQRVCCSHSQAQLHLKYPKKFSENNFSNRDCPETILHKLRPRIHRLQRKSETAKETVYKVCASRTRRKRTRLPIERCFVQYKSKHGDRGNQNPRVDPSQEEAGDFRSKTILVRSSQPSETSVANSPYVKNDQKPTSFIRSIKDYFFSTFREGTKWAKKYVYQAFKSDNKSHNSVCSPRKEERDAISSSPPQVVQPGRSDCKDKTRRRYKIRNNQRSERVSRSNVNAVMSRECKGNSSAAENPGNFLFTSNGKQRNCSVITNLAAMCSQVNDRNGNTLVKRGRRRSQCRRKRRKRCGRNKRIARNVMRYKKLVQMVRERRSYVRSNSVAAINSMKRNADLDIGNGNRCANNSDNNDFDGKKEEIEIEERGNQGIICLNISNPSWPSGENESLKKTIENK